MSKGRRASSEALQGWAFASPTAAFVIGLFLVPILLVVQMSASDWPLFTGRQGTNFPDNYQQVLDSRFFWPAIVFTLKYTVVTTALLILLGLGLALLVQETTRWKGVMRTVILVPSALGLASAYGESNPDEPGDYLESTVEPDNIKPLKIFAFERLHATTIKRPPLMDSILELLSQDYELKFSPSY